eukprot:2507855-Rhodomonas_salina.2
MVLRIRSDAEMSGAAPRHGRDRRCVAPTRGGVQVWERAAVQERRGAADLHGTAPVADRRFRRRNPAAQPGRARIRLALAAAMGRRAAQRRRAARKRAGRCRGRLAQQRVLAPSLALCQWPRLEHLVELACAS